MVIEKEINGEVKTKNIFEQDLSYFLSRGWKVAAEKPVTPAPNKKGRKRSFVETEVEEE